MGQAHQDDRGVQAPETGGMQNLVSLLFEVLMVIGYGFDLAEEDWDQGFSRDVWRYSSL